MHSLSRAVEALLRKTADEIVMPRFQNLAASEISEKTPGDFVTIADRESEVCLARGLAAILPDARIIGEEACAENPALLDAINDGAVWLIDPIDGTGNYASGKSPFGMMIALLQDGTRSAGWLFDPVSGRMCHAVRGRGAFINGACVQSRESGGALPVAALALHFLSEERASALKARARGHFDIVPIPRCAAEQYPRLVLGINNVSLFERSLPWDHAPGALFLEEAGGVIRRNDGSDYRVGDGKSGLLGASSPRLWDLAARVLFG